MLLDLRQPSGQLSKLGPRLIALGPRLIALGDQQVQPGRDVVICAQSSHSFSSSITLCIPGRARYVVSAPSEIPVIRRYC